MLYIGLKLILPPARPAVRLHPVVHVLGEKVDDDWQIVLLNPLDGQLEACGLVVRPDAQGVAHAFRDEAVEELLLTGDGCGDRPVPEMNGDETVIWLRQAIQHRVFPLGRRGATMRWRTA